MRSTRPRPRPRPSRASCGACDAIAPRPEGGTIRIVAARAGETLRLTVWDDGPGFTASAMWPGHGLDSLRARLAARYGATATLSVDRRDGGTLVTVSLPLARAAP